MDDAKRTDDSEHDDSLSNRFNRFAHRISIILGSPWTFGLAILLWVVTGPIFGFSDTWLLVISTGTTIVTFLMVFLIQNTQNRDAKATHLKLDELLRGSGGARNQLINLEHLSDEELARLEKEFRALRENASTELSRTKSPEQESLPQKSPRKARAKKQKQPAARAKKRRPSR